jgi:hypothetical protein
VPNHEERLRKISGVVVPISEEEAQKQREENPILPIDYRLFLVNEGEHDLTNVGLYTGGFEGTERLVELNRITRPLGELRRSGSVLIEELDIGILDFVLWYHLDLSFSDDVKLEAWFQIGKAYALRDLRYSTALESAGYYFPLEPRQKRPPSEPSSPRPLSESPRPPRKEWIQKRSD